MGNFMRRWPDISKVSKVALLAMAFVSTYRFAWPAEPVSSVWEEPVMPQPFERDAFRPVRIPDWVQSTVGVGYTLSVQTSVQRQRSVEAGVTISEVGFVDPL